LSLERLLWWYGEDKLWAQALGLDPRVVADLAEKFARLRTDKNALSVIRPGAPRDAYLLIPIIEVLEGSAEACGTQASTPSERNASGARRD